MIKIIIISSLFFIISWSCRDGDPLYDITGEPLENGGIYLDTLYAISDTSIVEGKTSLAYSAKLLLGSYSDFESRFLIRFTNMPPDSFQVDSLKLLLTSISNQGEALTPLTGTAYRVTEDWEESVNKDENWHWQDKIDTSPETSAPFEINTSVATTHIINLPKALMDFWQDTTGGGKNFGLLLDFNNTTYIKEFGSRNNPTSSLNPKMVAIYYDASLDSTISDTLLADKDVSLLDFKGNFDPNLIQITAGYSVKAFFKFDLSGIPKSAAFATMNFILKRDVVHSVFNDDFTEQMNLRISKTDYDALPYYEIDSTFVFDGDRDVILDEISTNVLDIPLSERGNNAQNFLQDIVNGEVNFGSFMVEYRNEWQGVSVYTVKGVDASIRNDRPKLILEYYNVPNPRL